MFSAKHASTLTKLLTAAATLLASAPALAQSSGTHQRYEWRARGSQYNARMNQRLTLSNDQVSARIRMPFAIRLNGRPYQDIYIGANGFVSFTPMTSGTYQQASAGIAAFATDLNPTGQTIFWESRNAPGTREFSVTWPNIRGPFSYSPRSTFQLIIYEGTNDFKIHCRSCSSTVRRPGAPLPTMGWKTPGNAYTIRSGNQQYNNTTFEVRLNVNQGPDPYGYWWAPRSIPYVNLARLRPRRLRFRGDGWAEPVNLPFTFRFYGRSVRQFQAHRNGFISLVGTQNPRGITRFPTQRGGQDGFIAGFWSTRWDPGAGGARWKVVGSGSTQSIIIEWHNRRHIGRTTQSNFQIAIRRDGKFGVNCNPCLRDGIRHSTGFEEDNGRRGLSVGFGHLYGMGTRGAILTERGGSGPPGGGGGPGPSLTLRHGGAYAVNEGATVRLNGSCNPSCPTGGGRVYGWSTDADNAFELSGRTPNFSAATIDGPSSRTVKFGLLYRGRYTWSPSTTVTVRNVNPTITSSPPTSANVGQVYAYNPTVTDPAGTTRDPPQWSLTRRPLGMQINASTGRIRWTNPTAGTHRVTLRVLDGDGGVDIQAWNIVARSVGGGPDRYGYTWRRESGFTWDNMTGSTVLGLAGFNNADTRPAFTGFPFEFYGRSYNVVQVASNGYLVMGNGTIDPGLAAEIPNINRPNAVIAGFWSAWSQLRSGNVRVKTFGSAPNRRRVFEWNNTRHANDASSLRMQVALHEGTSIVEVRCASCRSGARSAAVGVENRNGTVGLSVYHRTNLNLSNVRLTFRPPSIRLSTNDPYVVDEGGVSAPLNGSCRPSCLPASGRTYGWDFDGDDQFDVSGATPNFPIAGIDGTRSRTAHFGVCERGRCFWDHAKITIKNVAPSLTNVLPDEVEAGEQFTFQMQGQNPGGEGMVWGMTPVLPAWNINSATGVFNWDVPELMHRATPSFVVTDANGGLNLRQRVQINRWRLPQRAAIGGNNHLTGGFGGVSPRLYPSVVDESKVYLGYTSENQTGFVQVIENNVVTRNHVFTGNEIVGLVAHPDGSFAYLSRTGNFARQGANSLRIWLTKVAANGTQMWRSELSFPPKRPIFEADARTRVGDSRLAFGAGRYAAYYTVKRGGHHLDHRAFVSANGAVDTNDTWGSGCSHSYGQLISFNRNRGRFLTLCTSDTFPMIGLVANKTHPIYRSGGGSNGVFAQLGQVAQTADGWLLAMNADRRPITPDAQGAGLIHINENGIRQGDVHWTTYSDGTDVRDPALARIGLEQDGDFFLHGYRNPHTRLYELGVVDGQGNWVSGPEVTSRPGWPHKVFWGRRADDMRSSPDGKVVWFHHTRGRRDMLMFTAPGLGRARISWVQVRLRDTCSRISARRR